jgi:hypothetical protein
LEAFEKLAFNAGLYHDLLNETSSPLVFEFEKKNTIDLNFYKDKSYLNLIVYELLKKYKPTNDQILKLTKALFSSERKQIIIDKDVFFVKNGVLEREFIIKEVNIAIHQNQLNNYFEDFIIEPLSEINNYENGKIYIDLNQFNLPLKIKNVSLNEKVKPLGAKSYKSIEQILKSYKLKESQKRSLLAIEDAHSKFIGVLGLFQTEMSRINLNKGSFVVVSLKQSLSK